MSVSGMGIVTTIIVSALVATGSAVAALYYAPSLIPMPVQQPDVQLAYVSYHGELRIGQYTSSTTIDELTKTISLRQESVLIIVFSSKTYPVLYVNNLDGHAWVRLTAYVDGVMAKPSNVTISYFHEGDNSKGTCMVFHYPSAKAGSHTVTFQWNNRGDAWGYIVDPVVEIIAIPVKNAS